MKPFIQTRGGFYSNDSDGNLIMGVDSEKTSIQPGSTIEHKYSLYVGPSSIAALKEFGYGVEESVNYGMFGWISKGLIAALKVCHSVLGNWGLCDHYSVRPAKRHPLPSYGEQLQIYAKDAGTTSADGEAQSPV